MLKKFHEIDPSGLYYKGFTIVMTVASTIKLQCWDRKLDHKLVCKLNHNLDCKLGS
jgi:hypothetical protein